MAELTILDGAMGTMLQAAGLGLGERPELYGMEHPETVENIHRAYVEAGSQIIYANTFGANAHKLAGTGHTVEEVITANVSAARRVAGDQIKVALDVGPIGELLEPLGTLSFEEAYEIYGQMVRAGEEAGADLVVFETMTDLGEVRAAVLAAREQSKKRLPIWVTMSFEASGRTFAGTTVASMACTLDGLGVSAMGINCSLGPAEILPLIQEMRSWTGKPIIVKPNAGLPDPATGAYDMDPAEFARQMEPFTALGVSILGGCCGTTPEFIKALAQLPAAAEDQRPSQRQGVCSASRMAEFAGVRVIGKYGAAVVGLTMDKEGIPQSAEQRIELARRIVQTALSYGIPKRDVFIDCLTLTVSAQQDQARETLKAVRMVHEWMGLHCVLGVSNISFGLPARSHVTVSFMTQAMACGLDLPIVNPNQREIMDAVAAFRTISGEDRDCGAYIERFAQQAEAPARQPGAPAEMTIEYAVLKGLKQETAQLTEQLLETMSEMDVINQKLIPALDVVGDQYEKQIIFLPQLINAANAACAGFDLIKQRIASRGGQSVSKGKILLATVEGDIHDIGKNIVRVVLENYGYQVLDLGRDVPVQKVVDAAVEQDIHLVGLSALMTTTVDSMRRTIAALRESGHPCKIMVGGAVLTPDYAEEIGADFYAKDAKTSADIAKEVLG